MSPDQEQAFQRFKAGVFRLTGIDLKNYKERQMRRRLDTLMHDMGEDSYDDFLKLLKQDAPAREKFLRRVTINVSEFYRNPERFRDLSETYIPRLLQENPRLRVWSAGASTGEEPYSLAMVILKHQPDFSGTVLGTDVDRDALAFARQGLYPSGRLRYVPKDILHRFFLREGDEYRVTPEVKRRVELRHHDLMRDSFGSDLDLILCRNVVIYFTEDAKEGLYQRFARALRPGGILFTGSTEQIFHPRRFGMGNLSSFFYQRLSAEELEQPAPRKGR